MSPGLSYGQPAAEQFLIRFNGEDTIRFCPATAIPPVAARLGQTISLDVSIVPRESIKLNASVILPSGSTSSLAEFGALYEPPFPESLPGQTEASSFIQWTPSTGPSGLYTFQFVARGSTDVDPLAVSICNVHVDLDARPNSCLLTGAADGADGDQEVSFGDVTVGESASGVVVLSFSVPASQAAGDNQILHCQSDASSIAPSPATIIGDQLLVPLSYRPVQEGELNETISFYHVADAQGEDLCEPQLASEHPCVASLMLRGRAVAASLSATFENELCSETPQLDVVLSNETDETLVDLSVEVEPPLAISPIGDFSGANVSFGRNGAIDSERRFRIQYPKNPEEQAGWMLFARSDDSVVFQV
ncbi:MAG TPA: hypothetical protein VH681_11565, partial [Nitrospiraceae bacterium]